MSTATRAPLQLIMVCFIVATAMVPLMRKTAPPKAPSADAH